MIDHAPYIREEIAGMTDDELHERMKSNLAQIRTSLATHGDTPTADGLVPDGLQNKWPSAFMGVLSTLERRSLEVQLIREALPQRKEAREAERQDKKAAARAKLEQALAAAPGDAKALADVAKASLESAERVRQFVADLRTMAAASTLAGKHAVIADAASEAAGALGEPEPKLASLPDGLPDREEVKQVIALLSGRTDGFSGAKVEQSGNYSRIRDAASAYRK